jgi:3-isopropylmalate/(R)-2-methylmalate dehydratase small subunit
MEGLDSNFLNRFTKGDIIVAGKNFGCGSSREQAVICLKYVGVGAIIAETFSRIFFRNAINLGLPIFESSKASKSISNNDILSINIQNGIIENKTKDLKFTINPFPQFITKIIENGGLVSWIRKNLKIK